MPSTRTNRRLPKSPIVLGELLRCARELAGFYERGYLLTQAWIEDVQFVAAEGNNSYADLARLTGRWIVKRRDQALADAPAVSTIGGYLDRVTFDRETTALTTAFSEVFSARRFDDQVSALQRAALAQTALVSSCTSLQEEIVTALEEAEQRTRPDTKPDKKKKTRVIPEGEAGTLAIQIMNDTEGRTRTEIARQFTKGNESRAQSLLRQLRRYPDLFKDRD